MLDLCVSVVKGTTCRQRQSYTRNSTKNIIQDSMLPLGAFSMRFALNTTFSLFLCSLHNQRTYNTYENASHACPAAHARLLGKKNKIFLIPDTVLKENRTPFNG